MRRDVLRCEDFPAGDNLGEGSALVLLPLAHELLALDKYDEALAAALVEDLGVSCVATSHVCGCMCGSWCLGIGLEYRELSLGVVVCERGDLLVMMEGKLEAWRGYLAGRSS